MLAGELEGFNAALSPLRKQALGWLRYYTQLDGVACELESDEAGLFSAEEQGLFHMLEKRLARLRDEAQLLREYCVQVRELFQAELDIRQNRIMKILTVVTTVFLPLSLVAYLIGNQFGHELARGFDEIPGLGIDLSKLDSKAREEALVKAEAEIKKMVKVEWFGIDGALCLLYACLSIVISWGIITRTDWPVGIFAPAVAALMTTGIFIRYLTEVFTFGKHAGKQHHK